MDSPRKSLAQGKESSVSRARSDSPATARWAFINGWKVEPQADDRIPMFGSVVNSVAAPSVRRSIARRRHQAMHKAWSKDRHD
ncbi:MAG: hypothetical protein ABR556_00675 [Pyrinomonadaceae bacterium]